MLRASLCLAAIALATTPSVGVAAPTPIQPPKPLTQQPPKLPGNTVVKPVVPLVPAEAPPKAPDCRDYGLMLPKIPVGRLFQETVGTNVAPMGPYTPTVSVSVVGDGRGLWIHGHARISFPGSSVVYRRHFQHRVPLLGADNPCRTDALITTGGGTRVMTGVGMQAIPATGVVTELRCGRDALGFRCDPIGLDGIAVPTEPAKQSCPPTALINARPFSLPVTTHVSGDTNMSGRIRTELSAELKISENRRDLLLTTRASFSEKGSDHSRFEGEAHEVHSHVSDRFPRCIIEAIETPTRTDWSVLSPLRKKASRIVRMSAPQFPSGLVSEAVCATDMPGDDTDKLGCGRIVTQEVRVRLAPAPTPPPSDPGEGPI